MPPTFKKIKDRILGRRYDLSFSFVPPAAMKRLNRAYRGKNAPTDILSFPLTEHEGEIIICKSEVTKRAPNFDLSARHYLTFIFIHGCLHLKGLDHGRIMEKLEDSWCRTFKVPLVR